MIRVAIQGYLINLPDDATLNRKTLFHYSPNSKNRCFVDKVIDTFCLLSRPRNDTRRSGEQLYFDFFTGLRYFKSEETQPGIHHLSCGNQTLV
jgi:hypothetical protein